MGLVLFGVSFFELILYKIPCVVLAPKGKEKKFIIRKLKSYKIVVSSSLSEAIKKLNNIASDINYKKRIINLSKKISFSNRKKFYEKILRLK